jgi:hypothetical protein
MIAVRQVSSIEADTLFGMYTIPKGSARNMGNNAEQPSGPNGHRVALAAAIFDVDGVLVASPHESAWREALTGFADPTRFTTEFYQTHVAGKPRLEGARSTLEQLGVPHAAERALQYAAIKQALIDRLIAEGSFDAFPDAVRLAAALHAAGLRLALASSSKNADAMLRHLTLSDGRPLLSVFDADLSARMCRAASRIPRSSCWLQKPCIFRRPSAWWSRTHHPASRPHGPAAWPRSASPASATRRCCVRPEPISW